MTITLYLWSKGLTGFPSNICRSFGIEVNGRFVGLLCINRRSDEPKAWGDLHAPVAGSLWKWRLMWG